MRQDPSPSADESRLHALADGRLDPHEAGELRARLAGTEAQRSVEAWREQREMLRALHRDVLHEPVPPALAKAARHVRQQHRDVDSWRRWGGMAAAVLIAFAAGWFANERWVGGLQGGVARGPAADFGRQAVFAHVVYSPEVRHPVEVPAAEQEHLVQWLSKRLGRPLKVPDLSGQGYELVGGRLLPGEQGARAQFMYQNARADRITLYVGAIDPGKEGAATSGETAFHFTSEGGAASFYWVDHGFGYALAGRMERPQLLQLANSVHRQL